MLPMIVWLQVDPGKEMKELDKAVVAACFGQDCVAEL